MASERLFGDPDYLLRVATADIAAYQSLRDEHLATLPRRAAAHLHDRRETHRGGVTLPPRASLPPPTTQALRRPHPPPRASS
jgi:hypothetical protein